MPRFTFKMIIFPSISLVTLYLCVETLTTGTHFSQTINLRGHMPRLTLKMNGFPSISLESPSMCVGTLRIGFFFPR